MAESKLDQPEDLPSSKLSDHFWTPKALGGSDEEKAFAGLLDESKDQAVTESSIPLSPQWLYAKPSETKMEMRVPTPVSLGNSSPSTRKEVWRLDGSENKTDWRRIANDVENGRRWREEERESGLLGIRRDRRKVEHCVENVTIRERVDSRALPTSERWHDGRSSGHETWRDIKWSSKWGPEDKEKETRAEKRTEVWRRKILLLMNNRFLAATIQIQIVNQILVINGGHAIEWKLILVDQLPIGLHLDLNWGEDGWRAHLQDLALGEDDLMLLE